MLNTIYLDNENVNSNRSAHRRKGEKQARRKFILFEDIEDAPKKEWLVWNMLGAGEMSCAYGAPGSAKSALAINLSAHVGMGRDWFGRRVAKRGVLYVAAERSAVVKRRLAAIRKQYGVKSMPLAVVSETVDLVSNGEGAKAILDYCGLLLEQTGVPVGLIVIDTVSRVLAGADENSPTAMMAMVANLAKLQEETGAHILTVHHTPHDANRPRGHGSLLAAVDTTIRIENTGGIRRATVDKANDSPEGESVTFRLEGLQLNPKDETTTPIVIPADETECSSGVAKLSKNQNTMLNVLATAGRPLKTDEWNERAREAGIGVKRRATLFDLRTELKSRGLVYEGINGWSLK